MGQIGCDGKFQNEITSVPLLFFSCECKLGFKLVNKNLVSPEISGFSLGEKNLVRFSFRSKKFQF